MSNQKSDDIRRAVRENYGKIAATAQTGCACSGSSCCGSVETVPAGDISLALGYTPEELRAVPDGANLGLGCGNPQAIAALQPGETVLDLGSGAGFDCFLAAGAVGDKGRVIGVDMTPEMIDRARRNARKSGLTNVEFRLGELENLPLADGMVDVILSNCVINLSPEKERVFAEAYRVLKPGGRLAVSDVVATAALPDSLRKDMAAHTACIAGASSIEELEGILERTGFKHIRITPKDESRAFIREWMPGSRVEDYVVSANIEAVKPGNS
jgi:SAM-dependent methyltransferase